MTIRRRFRSRVTTIFPALVLAATAAMLMSNCMQNPRHYRGGIPHSGEEKQIAALPLVNFSQYEQASDIVMNSLIVELLESNMFGVVDPGLVEKVVLEKRLRLTDRLPLETLQELGSQLGVQYLLVGSINEFDVIQGTSTRLPTVSISLRIVTCKTGQIIWAATHSRQGDDAETVFGIGRIDSIERLAADTIREMIQTLKP